jgi:alkylation response protein AidB-like acyl-CoA dehydrogenase
MASQVIDWAIQAHGAAGVSDDFPLAYAYCTQRWLRLADGPDEVPASPSLNSNSRGTLPQRHKM